MARALLEYGADLDDDASAAAVESGHLDVLDVLLEAGARVRMHLPDGRTLLQAARDAEAQLGVHGLADRILQAETHEERAALEVDESPGHGSGMSDFIEPRLVLPSKPSWALLAAKVDFDALASAIPGHPEQHVASRSVRGARGTFLIRFRGASWTWVLLQLQDFEMLDDPWSLERIVAMFPMAQTAVAFRGLSAMTVEQGRRERHDLRAHQRTRRARAALLERVDEFAHERRLYLPNVEDVSDGHNLVLRVSVSSAKDVERLDVVVGPR